MVQTKKIFIILGPTSSGKTSLGINLCKRFKGEIISADSRQVCKYMDIGTGKVPLGDSISVKRGAERWVLNGINIWGYDLVTPDKYFSAYDYAKFALQKLNDITQQGSTTFFVGGTGFYIDVVTARKKPAGTKPNFELRQSLETTPTKNLLTWLMSLNPNTYKRVDKNNRARIIRSLEIELEKEKESTTPLPYLSDAKYFFIGLTAPREFLYLRVDKWANTAWEYGLVDEVTRLMDLGFGKSFRLRGLVYKSVVAFLEKRLGKKDALQRIKYDLHAYIRRQQTWFKKNNEVNWVDIAKDRYEQNVYNVVRDLM